MNRPANSNGRQPRKAVVGDAVRDGKRLWAVCEGCKYHTFLEPAQLARRTGYDATIVGLKARLRCSKCGGRNVDVRIDYGGPGVVAHHGPSTGPSTGPSAGPAAGRRPGHKPHGKA